MTDDPFGPWEPLSIAQVVDLFCSYDLPWWIAGGQAIDLFVGRQTRPHHDVDVQVLHLDQQAVRRHFCDWDLHAADPPGSLRPWSVDEVLDEAIHDIWCRPTSDAPWALQLMLMPTDGDRWLFRRDHAIGGDLDAYSLCRDGVPFVAPEIQLLYKSNLARDKDESDFEASLPLLDCARRAWLSAAITRQYPTHPWLARLHANG